MRKLAALLIYLLGCAVLKVGLDIAIPVIAQSAVPITFAWDLDPTHDTATAWEIEVDGVIKPCVSVTVTSADRRCTASIVPGVHTFRLRGFNSLGAGGWSSSVTQTTGSVPGLAFITSVSESSAPLSAPVTSKGSTFTYAISGATFQAD